MLINPVFASMLLILTSNVVNGGNLTEYYRCGDCVQNSWYPTAVCGGEDTWEGCGSWQGLCRWERYDCPDPDPTPPSDGDEQDPVVVVSNSGNNADDGLSVGARFGIVLVVLAAIFATAGVYIYVMWRKKNKESSSSSATAAPTKTANNAIVDVEQAAAPPQAPPLDDVKKMTIKPDNQMEPPKLW